MRWQAGARWFLQHLVDGDPASNNLSWQWAASTFGGKPYFMNRGNVVGFGGDRFPPHGKGDPLDAEYDELRATLFAEGPDRTRDAGEGLGVDFNRAAAPSAVSSPADAAAVAWVHGDMLRPGHPALRDGRPAVFVFDDDALRDAATSLKPVGFVYECLLELPGVTILRSRDVGGDVAAAVRSVGASSFVTGESPSPRVAAIA